MSHPPVATLLPHAGESILLDRVVDSGQDFVVCDVLIKPHHPYLVNGRVEAIVGLEMLAQSVGAFAGLQRQRAGEPARVGYLVGVNQSSYSVAAFECGWLLEVKCQCIWQQEGSGRFEGCVLNKGQTLVTATLTVVEPPPKEPHG